MKTSSVLIAKGFEGVNPHPKLTRSRLREALYEGRHVGALIVWCLAAIVVGMVLAAFV